MAKYTKQIIGWRTISEGGFVNDPDDPGGATNMGITLKTLANWRGVRWQDLAVSEVRNLTMAEANQIYKRNYWDTVSGDDLPAGLDYAVYDHGIMSGPGRAIKDLQRTLGIVVDGVIGSGTLNAIEKSDTESVIIAYCNRRFAFLKKLKTFKKFGKGWTMRVMGRKIGVQEGDIGVIDRAVLLAKNVKDIPVPVAPAPGKAMPEKENPWNKPEVLGLVGSAVAAVFSAVSGSPIIQYALAASVVAACAVAVVYAIKRINAMDPA
jgi:lysozyme family protein